MAREKHTRHDKLKFLLRLMISSSPSTNCKASKSVSENFQFLEMCTQNLHMRGDITFPLPGIFFLKEFSYTHEIKVLVAETFLSPFAECG